ncbi:YybH family protein [Micromonospora sp. NBC_01813]|uniref:YybH family protein n=1 Tax=Micromonospora sp. NBC_01813 TaxID=2975988 RepID=UPI002DD823E6|nr:nuclear transport factor 2 family protein [Micromonospora sp. NBC_01813]WSA08933.1 nuclear transport factor 2 family protein [Micromonospora sp. NBC_01813]
MGNATDPATPRGALDTLLTAIVAGDADAIVDCYAGVEDLHVFVEGPRWQTVGHTAVAKGWRDFCAAAMSVTAVDITDGPWVHGTDGDAAGEAGALSSLSATVRMSIRTVAGERAVPMRLTWVLRRDTDRWRIVHEHASQPLADPYGVGDWLVTPAAT